MSMLRLSELATLVDGRLHGADRSFDGVSTDTRTLRAGDLFVALRGPNFDGHDYLEAARRLGAAGAMIGRRVDLDLATVEVSDTLRGLGEPGRQWRLRCPARVIGITGSNGKTTLKEMTAAILARRGAVLATRGNLNNDIGVPLTLSRLRDEPFAVIEMGANHMGEIAYLSDLVHRGRGAGQGGDHQRAGRRRRLRVQRGRQLRRAVARTGARLHAAHLRRDAAGRCLESCRGL